MFVLKVAALLVFAQLTCGADTGDFDIFECFRLAVLKGVPDADIPTHEPLKIQRNATLDQHIGLWQLKADIFNLVWYNIPWWNMTTLKKIDDDGVHQVWSYNAYWDFFTITGDYDLILKGVLLKHTFDGDLTIYMRNVTWKGIYNFTVPTEKKADVINELTVEWENGDVSVDVTNMALIESLLEVSFTDLFRSVLSLANLSNTLGTVLKTQITEKWFSNMTRIDTMKAFCGNSTFMQ